jgi:hypothetical protein
LLVWYLVAAGVEDAVAQVGLVGAHELLCINVNQFAIRPKSFGLKNCTASQCSTDRREEDTGQPC